MPLRRPRTSSPDPIAPGPRAARRARHTLAAAAALLAAGVLGPAGAQAAALPAAAPAAVPAAAPAAVPAAAADGAVTVTVNARAGLAAVPDTGMGANHAIWDAGLGGDAAADLLKDAGVKMLRYPGGSYSDIYHWKTHTAPGGYVAPDTDFDTFMSRVRRTGAQPMIIANYGTGSPQEAAEWVKYANVTKGYGAKYWEIGNELYGNGHYGANWEADDHADKTPAGYAREVVAFADAMKAVDPTIKIGAVLTTPANWPDGIIAAGDSATWNQTVLSIAGPKIDFGIVHWYPSGADTAATLRTPAVLGDTMYELRRQITRYAGANADRIGIAMTEINSDRGRNTQPGAIFAADAYSTLLAEGVFNVDWWDVHNGPDKITTEAGQTDYNDFGLLSSGGCVGDVCEPPYNTPFPVYHAIAMTSDFARPGDRFVRAGSDDALVTAHAVRRGDGDVAVMLLNKDPDSERTVTIDYAGITPAAGAPTVRTLTNGATSVTTAQAGTATTQTLPPYSVTTLLVHTTDGRVVGAPLPPGPPVATEVTDRTATLSWLAPPGTMGGVKFEIQRQNGTTSEQWGETTGTSFTVRNLRPGTRYTVNVLARDTAGRISGPSAPLTFTTGAPAESTCAVKFAPASDWASGYVLNVTVTNNGTKAIGDWTLDFSWPTPYQQISGGWSATWTQQGRDVKIVGTAPLAAGGGSASAGTVVNYNGPNILPQAFTLNGTVCSLTP
ncbi:alpha-L-arabinofuranosidase [Sphaerisporangium rufum]|uniref:Alpha-L-arabinofuranosidase n=1 Tax=Sphaerisporangium rufum TaxID=1381558 RepID=A0A919V2P8_9ACTN|nr:cellulose binding domain-containing protein [Sphaerisporangium rufum]GII80954.1 alpha-L-arabinofuranosidase [Sphaerisporangium rufum]